MSLPLALDVASAKPTGKRPYFMEQEVERVLGIAMAAVQELAVARQRMDTLERILEAKGVMTRDEINAFRPDADQAAERGLWMQEYLVRVLRNVQQEGEAIKADARGDIRSEEVAAELSEDA